MKKKSNKKPLDEIYGYGHYYNREEKFSGKHDILFRIVKIGCDMSGLIYYFFGVKNDDEFNFTDHRDNPEVENSTVLK